MSGPPDEQRPVSAARDDFVSAARDDFVHVPVLRDRVADLFADVPAGVVVDATVGGAGHARAILERNPAVTVLGLDRDDDALVAAEAALSTTDPGGTRHELVHARFDTIGAQLDQRGIDRVSGVLFDLGVSSPQLDRADRGFSYRHDGPLDMRMDRSAARSAADIVNGYTESELADVLYRYGDERFSRRIAAAIVARRPLTSTTELAEIVRDAIPAAARRHGGHPAKRTFQALRIECNEELAVLADALDQVLDRLAEGGRCVVLSYHSGEDRIVKQRFLDASTGGCICPPLLPCVCGARPTVRWVRRGAQKATAEEIAANRRASSVRLRAVEGLAIDGGHDMEAA